MWPFKKRKPESPEEIASEKRLDEATREVAWDEFDKEAAREAWLGPTEPLGMTRAIHPRRKGGSDPGDERGMRDVLRDADEKS